MDLRELKELVRKGEGKFLEFKLKVNHPEKIIREVVAFANTEGGILLIGIGDDKSIKGSKFVDEDEYILTKTIEEHISPPIVYSLERIRVENGREVLIYHIKKSDKKPHFVNLDGIIENRKAYVRVEDKSVQASKEVREILKGETKGRNIKFHFGDKEKVLMQYLENNSFITLKTFAEIANISTKVASQTLVVLVLANVLKIKPNEQGDLFVVAAANGSKS